MAKLNKETIAKLTKLCKINCSETEQEAILKDLAQILDYFEQLNALDTTDVPPCNHVLADMVNVTRKDEVGQVMPRETFLANTPSHIGGMIRVPPVLKNEP